MDIDKTIEDEKKRLLKQEQTYLESDASIRERIKEQEWIINWLEITKKNPVQLRNKQEKKKRYQDELFEVGKRMNNVREARRRLDRFAESIKENRERAIQAIAPYI